uniref:3CxxC-type domain-containing protein n=1 Tax=Paramormyrops kingsleyae TaxID=1676925 RepID=A0A3B3QKQ6_9TELE
MTNQEWTQKFQEKVRSLNKPEKQSVEFDDTIESKHPAVGWQEFTCSMCYHHWGSCKSLVVFHMPLNTMTRVRKVKQRTYKQISLNDIMDKLTERILIKGYGQPAPTCSSNYQKKILKVDHLSEYGEACQRSTCELGS